MLLLFSFLRLNSLKINCKKLKYVNELLAWTQCCGAVSFLYGAGSGYGENFYAAPAQAQSLLHGKAKNFFITLLAQNLKNK
jgi:hypothetical protein